MSDPIEAPTDPIDVPIATPPTRCLSCDLPLHVLSGGLTVSGTDIINISILGCTSKNDKGTGIPCNMFEQEQGRIETKINQFEG